MTDIHLAITFFLQLAVILLVCRGVGWLGRFVGQTQVVAEMVAGIMLGPSLLGLLLPRVQEWLFPKTLVVQVGGASTTMTHPSMSVLYVVSQLGLVLYMFLVGIEFDLGLLGKRAKAAVGLSISGILVPFSLGALLSVLLVQQGGFFGASISPSMAAMYLGASMSITAFPVLARIIYEQNIAKTMLGTLTLAAGATDDAMAWCMLAVVLGSLKGSIAIAVWAIAGGFLFGLLMMTLGRRLLAGLEPWSVRENRLSPPIAMTVFVLLMASAWYTDSIGIHAVFGAFVLGAAMPRGRLGGFIQIQLQQVTSCLLLPVFFVYSGLNTQIGLLHSPLLWGLAALALGAAILGKFGGCTLAARLGGESWRDAATIGVLMNARGLMELIILNIGLKQEIITPTLFTIMVIMAVVTTLMASPIFHWLYYKRPKAMPAQAPELA